MMSKHVKITENCFFEDLSSEHLNDFGDYFIKILEKSATDLKIIKNLYEHEKVAENRLINKIYDVNYY